MGTSPIALPIEICPLAGRCAAAPTLRPTPPRQDQLRRAHQTKLVVCDQAIEAAFCRLKDFRRITTRYGKLARNYAPAPALAAVIAF